MAGASVTHQIEENLDAPETTWRRKAIVKNKPFLRKIYEEWYQRIGAALPSGPGHVLEIGSGGGFCDEVIDGLITSDVLPVPGVSRVIDAQQLPFADGELRAIVMNNVFHHLPAPRSFLTEATRCVRPGGALVMVEPWVTAWSRLIYRSLHHEPFVPDARDWEFETTGPLSGANSALPWMVFARDLPTFRAEYPQWSRIEIEPFMPFRYLLSGGFACRSLVPGFTFPLWKTLEAALRPGRQWLAMFAVIRLTKI